MRRLRLQESPWIAPWALGAIALATRLPLLGATEGEPDSMRFVVAVWQWIRLGGRPPAHQRLYGYYSVLAPGYFWFNAQLAKLLHPEPGQIALMLNAVSLVAAVLTAPMLYRVGRRFLPARAAFWAALAYLLTPGFWWLGLEAHPQGIALLLLLVALDRFLAANRVDPFRTPERQAALAARWAISAGALTAALLCRGDTVLLLPVFPVALLLQRQKAARGQATNRSGAGGRGWVSRRDWLNMAGLSATAVAGFWLLRIAIIGGGVVETGKASASLVLNFWLHSSPLHQLAPILTAPGVAIALFTLAGAAAVVSRRHRESGVLLLVAAAAPGLVFWLLITGNNVRHVTEFWLLLLWAGCLGWNRRWPRYLAPVLVAAVGLNWLVIPPNSNLTLYPSANVFASHAMVARRQGQMSALAAKAHREAIARAAHGDRRPVCFIGESADPYVLSTFLLRTHPPALWIARVNSSWQTLQWEDASGNGIRPTVVVHAAFSGAAFRSALARCPRPVTIEFAAPGRKVWYLGSELTRVRWLARVRSWARSNVGSGTAQSDPRRPKHAAGRVRRLTLRR